MYKIIFGKRALKDYEKIKSSPLKKQIYKLLDILEQDPYKPPVEKLGGDLEGFFSRRINIQHRLVYEIYDEDQIVKILAMWSHYENM